MKKRHILLALTLLAIVAGWLARRDPLGLPDATWKVSAPSHIGFAQTFSKHPHHDVIIEASPDRFILWGFDDDGMIVPIEEFLMTGLEGYSSRTQKLVWCHGRRPQEVIFGLEGGVHLLDMQRGQTRWFPHVAAVTTDAHHRGIALASPDESTVFLDGTNGNVFGNRESSVLARPSALWANDSTLMILDSWGGAKIHSPLKHSESVEEFLSELSAAGRRSGVKSTDFDSYAQYLSAPSERLVLWHGQVKGVQLTLFRSIDDRVYRLYQQIDDQPPKLMGSVSHVAAKSLSHAVALSPDELLLVDSRGQAQFLFSKDTMALTNDVALADRYAVRDYASEDRYVTFDDRLIGGSEDSKEQLAALYGELPPSTWAFGGQGQRRTFVRLQDRIVSFARDGEGRVSDIRTGDWKTSEPVEFAAWGKRVYTRSEAGQLTAWDLTEEPRAIPCAHQGRIADSLLVTGEGIAAEFIDGTIVLIDELATGGALTPVTPSTGTNDLDRVPEALRARLDESSIYTVSAAGHAVAVVETKRDLTVYETGDDGTTWQVTHRDSSVLGALVEPTTVRTVYLKYDESRMQVKTILGPGHIEAHDVKTPFLPFGLGSADLTALGDTGTVATETFERQIWATVDASTGRLLDQNDAGHGGVSAYRGILMSADGAMCWLGNRLRAMHCDPDGTLTFRQSDDEDPSAHWYGEYAKTPQVTDLAILRNGGLAILIRLQPSGDLVIAGVIQPGTNTSAQAWIAAPNAKAFVADWRPSTALFNWH